MPCRQETPLTTPLQSYLAEMHRLRSTGVATDEVSYYIALQNLLNELGRQLKPKVFCLQNPKNTGAGHPDFYLFTSNQLSKAKSLREPIPDAPPERGVIEAKGLGADARKRTESKQVTDYWKRYGLVLVTNYRNFVLVGTGSSGDKVTLESFSLAESEEEFWRLAAHPVKASKAMGTRFVECLTRVLLHRAPLAQPKDVAWFLASYARDALARVEEAGDLPALTAVRSALEQALGLKFEGDKGEHFFRSTLVQTLFYGVFSAWVMWCRQQKPGGRKPFDWHAAAWSLHVPMVRTLFTAVATPERLGPLELVETLDWTAAALNRVDRASFFAKFEEAQAVQYFYEPFLEAFDPELRKQLGVWYTPPEIVKYMVARVDAVLRSELNLADGLADPNVYILDPCCGTGSYLVEALHRIERTLRDKGGDALLAHDLKQAAMTRVFGFEIMPAPYVISHWQIGTLLQGLGAPLDDKHEERAGVYLTNALTGWEPPTGAKTQIPLYPELAKEREAAAHLKRDVPILVVLGNPPYNGFAGTAMEEERDLVKAYRATRRVRAPQGQGLNDLYVRFFRMAERRIVDATGKGVVCFISNYSWLDGLSFTGMRERYLDVFDRIWVDCLNGDKYKTGKLAPDGEPDPSIFSTERNPEGIQVGTAIALMARAKPQKATTGVRFRHLWGKSKRQTLVETAEQDGASLYDERLPPLELGLPFMPLQTASGYLDWPKLPELFPTSFPGVKTSRDEFLVDIDRDSLLARLRTYFDPEIADDEIRRRYPNVMERTTRFDPIAVRRQLTTRGFLEQNVVRYCYRPCDVRWLYWDPDTKLLDEKRQDYFPHVVEGNIWIEARERQPKEAFDRGYVVTVLADNFGNGLSSFLPLYLVESLTNDSASRPLRVNVTARADAILKQFSLPADHLFHHTISCLHSPTYRRGNAGALRQDWPRVPLPAKRDRLEASAALGGQLAALLDTESLIDGVSAGKIRAELQTIGVVSRVGGGGKLKPPRDLEVTAGWGHAGKAGVTMPGKGKWIERGYTPDERAAIIAGARKLGLGEAEVFTNLGDATRDIYLNGAAYWSNVPAKAWDYTIGGYQVIKKWLSYREYDLLGRALTPDEARHVTEMARRIVAILLMQPALDANYRAVIADTYPWPRE